LEAGRPQRVRTAREFIAAILDECNPAEIKEIVDALGAHLKG
jgi:hypothetical protein